MQRGGEGNIFGFWMQMTGWLLEPFHALINLSKTYLPSICFLVAINPLMMDVLGKKTFLSQA